MSSCELSDQSYGLLLGVIAYNPGNLLPAGVAVSNQLPDEPFSRECSALLRRLRHKTAELRHDLRALALRASHSTLLAFRDGHDHFEGLVALLTHELVVRHGTSLALSSSLPQRLAIKRSRTAAPGVTGPSPLSPPTDRRNRW